MAWWEWVLVVAAFWFALALLVAWVIGNALHDPWDDWRDR